MFKEIIFSTFDPWKVIDDDFVDLTSDEGIVQAVINTYEKRNLEVAPNLVKAILWWNKESGYPVDIIINTMKEQYPMYCKYDDQVRKYLTIF
jgi:hypothetical protein